MRIIFKIVCFIPRIILYLCSYNNHFELNLRHIIAMNLKVRLAVMNFLEFAVWGAYLTSMGNYLGKAGMGAEICLVLYHSGNSVYLLCLP